MNQTNPSVKERVWLIDEIRGLAILLMIVYHAFFDIVVVYGVNIPAFYSPELGVIRDFFAGVFVFISGTACRFSRNNLKRGVQCFFFGMILTFVTAIAEPDYAILFGILHFLGIAMILFSFTERFLDKVKPWVGMLICAVLTALTANVMFGSFGIPGLLSLPVPDVLTQSGQFFPFGFVNATFASSDYFPLLPWLFVFLAGAFFGVPVKEHRMPEFFYQRHIRPLAFVGRHTLWIYLLHQPVIMAVCIVVFNLIH